MGFHFLENGIKYVFYDTWSFWGNECEEQKKLYGEFLKDAKTVRLVGTEPGIMTGKYKKNEDLSERFNNIELSMLVRFIRVQVDSKCKSYDSDFCKFPDGYWGPLLPQK